MSRIGNQPIQIPKGVNITTSGTTIRVKGPKGELSFDVPSRISFKVDDGNIVFSRESNDREARSLHGMSRAMTANMVTGCSEGFKKVLVIKGVGYRAMVKGVRYLDETIILKEGKARGKK